MNIFKRKVAGEAGGYVTAAPANKVKANRMTFVKIGGQPVILTRLQGQVYAVSALCPHAAGDLSKGALYKGQIDCPDHGYRFDVRSGRATWPEDEVCHLKRYSVKEEDGLIKVKLA